MSLSGRINVWQVSVFSTLLNLVGWFLWDLRQVGHGNINVEEVWRLRVIRIDFIGRLPKVWSPEDRLFGELRNWLVAREIITRVIRRYIIVRVV